MLSVKRFGVALIVASLLVPSALMARQNIVRNGSLEFGPGQGGPNPFIPAGWTEFGENVERSREVNRTADGEASLKAFGDSVNPAAGGRQEVAAEPDDQVTVTGWLYTRSTDKLSGSGEAGIRVQFLGLFGSVLATHEAIVVDAGSPGDTWIEASIGPVTAPSGTLNVRVICVLDYTIGDIRGSVYWDDVVMTGASGGEVVNGDFETAGISTDPNPTGIDEWVGFNDQQKSDEAAYHGGSSVKLGVEEPYSGLVQEMGELTGGDRIVMTARAMIPSSDPLNGNARVGIKLEFADSLIGVEENLAFDEDATTNSWIPVELSTTVPEDASLARIVCVYAGGEGTSGSVFFDTAEARRDGGSNQLLNPSFEEGFGGPGGLDHWTEFFSDGVSSARKSCLLPPEIIVPADGDCTMRARGQAVAGVWQEIEVVPGETLDISALLYSSSADPLSGPGSAGMKVEWRAGSVPEGVDIVPGGPNTIDAGDPEDVWHELTIDFTMPEGTAALAKFTNIIARGSATTGSVHLDGCEAVVLNRFDGADVDGDDDADLAEFAVFQDCFVATPPPDGTLAWPCHVFDHDENDVIDMEDYAYYATRITGPQ